MYGKDSTKFAAPGFFPEGRAGKGGDPLPGRIVRVIRLRRRSLQEDALSMEEGGACRMPAGAAATEADPA